MTAEGVAVAGEARTRRSWPAWLRALWVPLALTLVALGVAGGVTVGHPQQFSPVDEWVYVDYLQKVPEQGFVRQGELIGEEALDAVACRGIIWYGTSGPPCGSDYSDTSAFPFEGVTSAADYTPAYFALTRVVGDALAFVTGTEQLTGWRLTSVLWLVGGLWLFWRLLRSWRVADTAILGLGLAFIATPLAWWTFTFVSTDAPSFAFGAALLLAADAYVRGRASGWWIPLLSLLAVLFKASHVLAVLLAALYLLVMWLWEVRRTSWSGVRTVRPAVPHRRSLALPGFGVLAIAVAAAAQLGWLTLRSALSTGAPADQGVGGGLSPQALLAEFGNFLPHTMTANVVLGGGGSGMPIPPIVHEPLAWLCIAGVVGGLLTLRHGDARLPLAVTVALASVLFAPLLALATYVLAGVYFELPPRYGLPILPAILLMVGVMLRTRLSRVLVLGYAAFLVVVIVVFSFLFAGLLP